MIPFFKDSKSSRPAFGFACSHVKRTTGDVPEGLARMKPPLKRMRMPSIVVVSMTVTLFAAKMSCIMAARKSVVILENSLSSSSMFSCTTLYSGNVSTSSSRGPWEATISRSFAVEYSESGPRWNSGQV